MIPFQRMSIHNKLAFALGGAVLLAFAVASIALALFGSLTLERRARQIMEPYAQLVSVGAEAAVAFEDPGRAREILNTMRANPQILEAEIVLRDGRLLARYASTNATFHPHPPRPDGVYLNDYNAELMQSLPEGAHLHLVMGLEELNRQTRNFMLVFAAGVLVLLVATTLGLRAALQRTIVRPISTLAETVEQVRSLADYQQRVPASGSDEVAQLGKSFNAMMGAIQEREDDLRLLTLFQRTILENAAYGIISVAPDGIVSSFNRAAERLLGYTADEAVGKLTPACWHDPEEVAQRARQLSEELGETILPGFDVFAARPRRSLPEENEWTFIRKDGTRLPVLLSVTALRDESGRITGFVGLTYDLTERKQAEEALRAGEAFLNTLLNAIPIPVFYKDRDGRYLGFNRAYETFFGATRDQLIGKTVFDINPRELAESYRAKDTELFESGGVQQYESQVKNTHGVMRDVIFNKAVFTDSQGTIIGLIGAILDITERKRAEEERLAHLRVFESLDHVNRAMQGTNDLEQMMSDVLGTVLSIFECDRAYLMYPCDPEAESWVIPMERTTPDYPGAKALGVDLSKDAGIAGKLRLLLSSDGPVNMGYGTPYMLSGTTAEQFSIGSMMAMAVYPKVGKPWEFGIHQCSCNRVWNPEEERLLKEIGRRLEDALTSLLTHRDLRESEAKYRRIVDTASEGIWVVGPDNTTSFVNARIAEMLGCSSEEMIGRPFADFMFEEDVPDHLQKMDNRRKGISETYERRFRRKGGHPVWTHVSATPIFDDEHHFQGSFAMFTDITERKRAEKDLFRLKTELEERVDARTKDLDAKRAELEESQKALINIVEDLNEKTGELELANSRLQELDRLKSMFIASMSHELRTPLNSVIGFSSVMLNEWVGPVNAEQKENLAIILKSGRHLLNLINDVIDVSKIEAGKLESLAEEFDLHDLIFEAVSLVKKELEEKGLDLRVAAAHQQMRTDRRRLLQCVLNLLSNAVKFTEQGGVTVETRIEQSPGATPESGFAEISVTDTGIGIREEDIGKMFQPFERLFSPLQSTVPGTGLGLYLTRKLTAEVLKGDIMLTSEYGKGSRFTIKIPVGMP